MELRSLHYFVRIAELGSITRAAAHLHVAQPALTRHVQRLEQELNVALFTRANRGVRLTEAGQKLLDGAARILRDLERTGDEIRAQDAHPSGKIILGITPTLCPVLVPELFGRMQRDYPAMDALLAGLGIELKVEIEINDHETMRLMVQQGVGATILPYSSVARECARGLLAAHRITEPGIYRTLALGVRASRDASLARETV